METIEFQKERWQAQRTLPLYFQDSNITIEQVLDSIVVNVEGYVLAYEQGTFKGHVEYKVFSSWWDNFKCSLWYKLRKIIPKRFKWKWKMKTLTKPYKLQLKYIFPHSTIRFPDSVGPRVYMAQEIDRVGFATY